MEKGQPLSDYDYDIIASIVNSHFVVKDYYIKNNNIIEFRVDPLTDLKKSFADVTKQLKPRGFIAFLMKLNGDIVLSVGKITRTIHFSKRTPLLLF